MPIPVPMKYSKSAEDMTTSFEGFSATPYQDQGGVWTQGYGHTQGVTATSTAITRAQAIAWLESDIAWAEAEVNAKVNVQLTQAEFDALVDFTFNCGCANFEHSTLLRLVNHGDLDAAAQQFELWDHVGGKVVAGLLRRRLAEKAMFLGTTTTAITS